MKLHLAWLHVAPPLSLVQVDAAAEAALPRHQRSSPEEALICWETSPSHGCGPADRSSSARLSAAALPRAGAWLSPPRRALAVLLLLAVGCSDPPAQTDAGPDLASPDGGASERGPSAEGGVDLPGPLPCTGLTLDPLKLDPGYCVAARLDLPQTSLPAALALQSGRLYTLSAGGSPFVLELHEHLITPTGQLGSPLLFFSATPSSSAAKIFAGEYLALSPGASTAAVGYNEGQTFEGGIYRGRRGVAPALLEKASGNFDALFLDEKTLLVNGQGLGAAQQGQGVYLAREGESPRLLIKDLGVFSGYLALTRQALLVGGYFTTTNKIFGLSLTEVNAAVQNGTALSATSAGDLVYQGELLDATALEDDLVVAQMNATTFKIEAVARLPLSVSGSTVSAQTAAAVLTVPAGSSLGVERLASFEGQLAVLVSGGSYPQVAILRRQP